MPLPRCEGMGGPGPMPNSLLSIFSSAHDLLALEPEELGGVLLEIIPGVLQNGIFSEGNLAEPAFWLPIGGYPSELRRPV